MIDIIQFPVREPIELIKALLGGAVGSLAKDCLQDGVLCLPYKEDGKLYMGFIGGIVIGAFVGLIVDGSFTTAALAGYTGTSLITNLIQSQRRQNAMDARKKDISLTNDENGE